MSKWLSERGIRDIQTTIRNYINAVTEPGDTVVDATAGRGRDTLFLAQCVGPAGKVFAFDIQEEAVKSTWELITKCGYENRVEIISASHAEITSYVHDKIKAVVFNLGYLPGSDSKVTTCAQTTISAVAGALTLLEETGIMAITVYRGHENALQESQEILAYLSNLKKKDFSVLQGIYPNQKELSPYWVIIQKNRRKTDESQPAEKNSGASNR